MINQPMSPELVRLVHDRQLVEAARRGEARRLADALPPRSGLRLVVGAALVRAGQAISPEAGPGPRIDPCAASQSP